QGALPWDEAHLRALESRRGDADVKKQAPKTLYWGQADWFFDGEGVGLHYQANQITKDAPQLDIYLTTEQTNGPCLSSSVAGHPLRPARD
ncbi:hypothetical protein ACTXQV_65410, partial [Klebsiella pneumoniae]